jgi:hypothetical protein
MGGTSEQLRFELAGIDVRVDCLVSGDDVTLDLEYEGRQHQASGDRVRSARTDIGRLVMMDLRPQIGDPLITFAVLLPRVEFAEDSAHIRGPVRTFVIRCVGPEVEDPEGPMRPPPFDQRGVLGQFEAKEVAGTASLVDAIQSFCQQWSAVRTILRGPDDLTVEAICAFPRRVQGVELTKPVQPADHDDLRLELMFRKLAGPTREERETLFARYVERLQRRPYKTVTIAPVGLTIPVESTLPCERVRATLSPPGGFVDVDATFLVPLDGYQVALRRAEPQGRNPKDLWLQVHVTEPDEPTEKRSEMRVASYKEVSLIVYETVTILPNNVTAAVELTPSPPDPSEAE